MATRAPTSSHGTQSAKQVPSTKPVIPSPTVGQSVTPQPSSSPPKQNPSQVANVQPPEELKHNPVFVSDEKDVPFVEVMQRNDKATSLPPMEVMVRFNRNCSHESEVINTLAKLQDMYNVQRKFVILFDAFAVTHAERSHLQFLKQFLKNNQETADTYTVAVAIVLGSDSVKLGVQTILFFRKTPFPIKVFKKLNKAKEWVKTQTEQFQQTLPQS